MQHRLRQRLSLIASQMLQPYRKPRASTRLQAKCQLQAKRLHMTSCVPSASIRGAGSLGDAGIGSKQWPSLTAADEALHTSAA
eukprot:1158067-Pelagomonas_calceolata.AAC.9